MNKLTDEQLTDTPTAGQVMTEEQAHILRIHEAAEASGRILLFYPPDGKVKGWVLIFNGNHTQEVRTNG